MSNVRKAEYQIVYTGVDEAKATQDAIIGRTDDIRDAQKAQAAETQKAARESAKLAKDQAKATEDFDKALSKAAEARRKEEEKAAKEAAKRAAAAFDRRIVEAAREARKEAEKLAKTEAKAAEKAQALAEAQAAAQAEARKLSNVWATVATGVKSTLDLIGSGFSAIQGGIDSLKEAAQSIDIENAFKRQFKDATKAMDELRAAADAQLDDTTLQNFAASLRRVGVEADKIQRLVGLAVRAAQEPGRNVGEVLEQIRAGVSSGEAGYLAQLNATVNAEAALKSYAESIGKTTDQLTGQEKAAAAAAISVESLGKVYDGVNPGNSEMAKFNRLAAEQSNHLDTLKRGALELAQVLAGTLVGAYRAVVKAQHDLTVAVLNATGVGGWTKSFVGSLRSLARDGLSVATSAVRDNAAAVLDAAVAYDEADDSLAGIVGRYSRLATEASKVTDAVKAAKALADANDEAAESTRSAMVAEILQKEALLQTTIQEFEAAKAIGATNKELQARTKILELLKFLGLGAVVAGGEKIAPAPARRGGGAKPKGPDAKQRAEAMVDEIMARLKAEQAALSLPDFAGPTIDEQRLASELEKLDRLRQAYEALGTTLDALKGEQATAVVDSLTRAGDALGGYGQTFTDFNALFSTQVQDYIRLQQQFMAAGLSSTEANTKAWQASGPKMVAAAGKAFGGLIKEQVPWSIFQGTIETAQGIAAAVTPGRQWEAAGHFVSAATFFAAAAMGGAGGKAAAAAGAMGGGAGIRGAQGLPPAQPTQGDKGGNHYHIHADVVAGDGDATLRKFAIQMRNAEQQQAVA